MYENEIAVKARKLPGNLRREALDYIEFLLEKYGDGETPATKFKFDWEGGLADIRDKTTSVELQHQAAGWR